MSFALNEDQALLKETADSFFAEKAPVGLLRRLRDAGQTSDPALWSEVGAMGFCGGLIGEDHGGTAMGFRALALALEAEARTLGSSPLFQTGWVCAAAINMFGTDAQKASWLPRIASGEARLAFAHDEGPHHRMRGLVAGFAEGKVSGLKRFVPDGAGADWLLVTVALDGDRFGLALVDAKAAGVSRTPLSTVDTRDAADIRLDGAVGEIVGGESFSAPQLDGLLDIARAGVCAQMLGVMGACFTMTVDYLQTRTQFGQLIGSFQALQHRASNMLVEIELTRSCVVAALSALDTAAEGGLDPAKLGEAVSLAKARASDTLQLVTNEMIQMHGGIGMTDAHDSGLYLKRARVLETQYGSAAFHRDRWARLNGY
jgi:alkylation response protein AidB-like acyl-CoA dehydrogenase